MGGVVAGTLLLVALVAGVMAAASSGPGWLAEEWFEGSPDSEATAEVLDVDEEEFDWVTVDIRWTTDDGEVVVTWIDWYDEQLPDVGDQVDIVYDSTDPEYSVFAADDPYVDELTEAGSTVRDEPSGAADGSASAGEVAGWVALGALVLLVLTVLATVVAAVRAPAPTRHEAGIAYQGDPLAWQPGSPPPGCAPTGYPPSGYAPTGQPAPAPPTAPRPTSNEPVRDEWSSPG